MKIAIVLGTRPEIIKMASLIRECEKQNIDYFVIHTNQHYSKEMDSVIFDDLRLKQPKYNLEVGSGIHGLQTGKMLERIEEAYHNEKPDVTLVQGDTNTTLSGALAAIKMGIQVGHVEGGLRSFDRSMPEEINRVLIDHIAHACFAPTKEAEGNLLKEGIPQERIHVVGNTVVDALYEHIEFAKDKEEIFEKLEIEKGKYVLVTWHRAENTKDRATAKEFIQAFDKISTTLDMPVLLPLHPRTEKVLAEWEIELPSTIKKTKPLGYLEFLLAINESHLILTDSGGIQEEACILKKPCVTLRNNTERPETIEVGGNILGGTSANSIVAATQEMLGKQIEWSNPFGDGQSAKRILDICLRTL